MCVCDRTPCLTAVICNMAFETIAFRREIHTFKGIEAMVKVSLSPLPPLCWLWGVRCLCAQLAGSPNQRVVRQALGALLNMAVTESLREAIGKNGAIEAALSKLNCITRFLICCLSVCLSRPG